jgi:peptidyl-dipeptidase Dcp
MHRPLLVPALAGTLLLGACAHDPQDPEPKTVPQTDSATPTTEQNPLLRDSTLPYGAPDYAAVQLAHFGPAFERAMQDHAAEIAAITNNAEPPSFDNTIVALERSGQTLSRTANLFFSLTGTMSTDELQVIEGEMAPKLTAHQDSITLDAKLYERVAAVYATRESAKGEERRLIEKAHDRFVRAGAKLDEPSKAQIRSINSELASLTTEFSQNLLAASKANAVVVDDVAQLAGLSEGDIAGLAAAARAAGTPSPGEPGGGKYLINLLNTTHQPILSQLQHRPTRQRVWEASASRGLAENSRVIQRIVTLRAAKAKLLGYPTWAHYVLEEQMAKTPDAVLEILDDLAPRAAAKAKAESKLLAKAMKADKQKGAIEPWDWAYYAEKVRAKQFDIDEAEVRKYFELERVLQDGVFFTMGELFGLRFVEREDLPTYHEDVRTFEVLDESGAAIGLFYADYYARDGKRGGAWMDELIGQSHLLGDKPVVLNVLNVPKPAPGEPALLTFDEATTMFHEMGHAVHGLLSNATYPSLAGTSVPRDYVEFPSQFEEDWLLDPKVLGNVARHHQTGEPIPKPLLDKLLASREFNQGFESFEYLAAALLDMEWHLIGSGVDVGDVAAFEAAALAKHGLDFAPVAPRYKSAYFAHVFAGGYSAGYYAYLWTEVLAADAFAFMGSKGGLTRANGDLFRELILSKGNTVEPMQQYINYRGQEPSVDALLKRRGLVD